MQRAKDMQDTLAEDLQFCMSGPDKATYPIMGEIHRPVEQNKEAGDRPTYLSVCQDRACAGQLEAQGFGAFLYTVHEMDSWWSKDLSERQSSVFSFENSVFFLTWKSKLRLK